MATPLDALAYKSLILEWADITLSKGLYNNLDEISAVNMSLLDPKFLEEGSLCSPAYHAIDVSAALQREKTLCRREEYITRRLNELRKPEKAEIFDQVVKLLDDDLTMIGDMKAGLPRTLGQKAFALRQYQMKDVLMLKEEPQGYNDSEDKRNCEFKVFLTTLIGGDGGSPKLCAKLYFKYEDKDRFSYFLRCLQDETQLSTIPPVGIPEPLLDLEYPHKCIKRSGEFSELDEPISSTSFTIGDSFASSCTISGSQTPSQPQTPLCLPQRRRRSIRGYTLEDGFWLYRIAKIDGINTPEVYHELKDLMSYIKMVHTVRDQNLSSADTPETVVIITHSMDRAAILNYEEKVAQEKVAQEKVAQEKVAQEKMEDLELGHGIGDEDEDGIDWGRDTYLEWLARNNSRFVVTQPS